MMKQRINGILAMRLLIIFLQEINYLDFALPGTLKVIVYPETWARAEDKTKYFPIFQDSGYVESEIKSDQLNFVMIDCFNDGADSFTYLDQLSK